MGKITEDIFNVTRFMLNNGKDNQTIMNATGLSQISIDRISKAKTYADYDEQRKVRTSKINRNNTGKTKAIEDSAKLNLTEQIAIDDLLPQEDSIVMLRRAIDRNTNAIESLVKQLSFMIGENVLRGA